MTGTVFCPSASAIICRLGNYLSADKTVAVLSPDSAPIKRLIADGREKGLLVDASFGRSTRSVLLMNSGHLILSAQSPEELMKQLNLIQEGGRLPSAGEN